MSEIATFVFFDIETTGLPFQEQNKTKIIEASFVAVLRKDIVCTPFESLPPITKLTFQLNPGKSIHPEAVKLTGLSNKYLKYAPYFNQKFHTIEAFLDDLPKPVCLVAHNGNCFDYKILLAECNDARVHLPQDLKCVDSIVGFRKLLKANDVTYFDIKNKLNDETSDCLTDDTSDEDDWPELEVASQDWEEIDGIEEPSSNSSCEDFNSDEEITQRRDTVIKNIFTKKMNSTTSTKGVFTLTALYKRLLNKDGSNAHRAEADCFMLIECVIALKEDFLPWADGACKYLNQIKPLQRY